MSVMYLILYKSESIELTLPSDATIETLKKEIFKLIGLHPSRQDFSDLNDFENNELLSEVCPPDKLLWLASKKNTPKRNYVDPQTARLEPTVSSPSGNVISNPSTSRDIHTEEQVNGTVGRNVIAPNANPVRGLSYAGSKRREHRRKGSGTSREARAFRSSLYFTSNEEGEGSSEMVEVNVEETAYLSFIQIFTSEYGQNHIKFECCSLNEALLRCHTTTSRKMLILYFHNKNDRLSKVVCPGFVSGEMRTILERSYNVLAWDVSNNANKNLKNVLDECIELIHIKQWIIEHKSALIIINPSVDSIVVLNIMKGDTLTLNTICEQLKSVDEEFQASLIQTRNLQELEQDTRQNNDIGSREFHQMMFDRLGDRDYDSFEPNQHTYLKEKIGFAKFGPPQSINGYDATQKKSIDETYNVIVYNNSKFIYLNKIISFNIIVVLDQFAKWIDRIVICFIYNCLEPLPEQKLERAQQFPDYNPYTDIKPTPIFVIRKCKGISQHPCRMFVDCDNRVYSSWEDYITNNKLEKAVMVLPKGGRYYGDANGAVILERHQTPSCSIQHQFLQHVDTASSFVGIASGGVLLTTAIPAIALAPMAVSAAVVAGAGVGVYSIFRSGYHVYDRLMHGESMSFTNSEARGAYLNILAGTLGFVGAGATGAMSQLAAEGAHIGEGARTVVNVLNITNAGLGAAALANASYDMYDTWREGGTISTLSLIQLGSSVLFFGNAVYSFRTANTIINDTQTNALRNHQESLRSNRHRKTFNKLVKETIRQNNGNVQAGRAEVISSISNMANRDETFAVLTRNNKRFNKNGVRFASKDGKITLNGISVNLMNMDTMSTSHRTQFLIDLPPIPNANSPNVRLSLPTTTSFFQELSGMTVYSRYGSLILRNSTFLLNATAIMLNFPEEIQRKIFRILMLLLEQLDLNNTNISQVFREYFPRENPFSFCLTHIIQFLKIEMNEHERRYRSDNNAYPNVSGLSDTVRARYWFHAVVNSFVNDNVDQTMLNNLLEFVMTQITSRIYGYNNNEQVLATRNARNGEVVRRKTTCSSCKGYYYWSQ